LGAVLLFLSLPLDDSLYLNSHVGYFAALLSGMVCLSIIGFLLLKQQQEAFVGVADVFMPSSPTDFDRY